MLRDARTLTRLCGSACACALLRMRTAELAARRRTVFGNSRLTMSNSHSRSRGAFLRPGFCILCFTDPESRGGRSAEKRSGAQRNTRGARHLASKTRVNALMTRRARRLRGALRPMTRDARLSALHRGGFGLPGPRFRLLRRPASYNGGQVPCGSVQRAPRTQVVVPGGRGPCLPRRAVTSHPPQDATPRSAFRIVSGDAPHERGCECCSMYSLCSQERS